MNDSGLLLYLMRNHIEHVEKASKDLNWNHVDYYLGLLGGNILEFRKLYGRKPCESAESSDQS